MNEQWKAVPGYQGRYEVSDQGRVRSLDHRVRLVVHGVVTSRRVTGRVLRPGPSKSGHLTVAIGKGNSRPVHQLVLEAFIGPRPEGCETLHLDNDPSNNRLTNLRYGTKAENMQQCVRDGRHFTPFRKTQNA